MALRRNFPAYRQLDQLVMEGRAQMVATPPIDTAVTPAIVATQAGEVAIITKIVSMVYPQASTSPDVSAGGESRGFDLYDETGTLTGEGVRFTCFQKANDLFFTPAFPDAAANSWQTATPPLPVVWEPEEPLIVPPLHTLRNTDTGGLTMAGGNFVCYGYITDIGTARTLGFSVGSQGTKVTLTEAGTMFNHSGFRGAVAGAVPVEMVFGKPGFSIQIIDVYMRCQPFAAGSTTHNIFLTQASTDLIGAAGTIEIATAADTQILFLHNNNHSDMAELKMSPGIYLEAGKSLFLATLTSPAGRGSAAVTYRYVKAEDVPEGHFWSRVAPTAPVGSVGTSSLFTAGNTAFTLRYPGRINKSRSVTTATSPGVGYQHIVEGYAISAQKDATIPSDRAYFHISEGESAGNAGVTGSGLNTTNNLISPMLCLGSHNQCLALAVDGLNVPCTKDTGTIRVEMTGAGAAAATPAASDLDIDEFNVLIWGRTIPSKFGVAHFKGETS